MEFSSSLQEVGGGGIDHDQIAAAELLHLRHEAVLHVGNGEHTGHEDDAVEGGIIAALAVATDDTGAHIVRDLADKVDDAAAFDGMAAEAVGAGCRSAGCQQQRDGGLGVTGLAGQ